MWVGRSGLTLAVELMLVHAQTPFLLKHEHCQIAGLTVLVLDNCRECLCCSRLICLGSINPAQ